MKIIFIFNFYKSFKYIIKKKKIEKVGNVSLINFIKKISNNNLVKIYLLEKDKNTNYNEIIKLKIDNIEFTVIPINQKRLFFKNFYLLSKEFFFSKKKTFYIDRGNIFFAYLIKVFSNNKVILRILGITKVIESSLIGIGFKKYLNKILWKKKYDLVINSNDGSNYKNFCLHNMSKKNKYLTLNQSIDRFPKIKIKKNKFQILLCDNFSSKYKNFLEILKILKFLEPEIKKKIKLIFVYSNYYEKLKIQKYTVSFDDVNLIPRQNNNNLLKYKLNSDALLTFNSMGYLSNNILESIHCNNWIITPLYSDIINNVPNDLKKNFIFLKKDNLKIDLNNKIKNILKIKKNFFFKNIGTNTSKVEKEFDLLRKMKFIQ